MPGINMATWGIAALATFGVIARPWNLPEFVWAVVGAALLVVLNLLPWQEALAAAGKGMDVYLFLIGMMLLAEVARKRACSAGSPPRPCVTREARPNGCS